MKLQLATKKIFEGMEVECYVDSSREDGDFYMTRKQIGDALEYKAERQLNVIVFRHREEIGDSVSFKLKSTDNKYYDTELYSFNQLFQILRFSKQLKANIFMQWSATTLQELIVGRAELQFKTVKDETTYKERIGELSDRVKTMTGKVDIMEQTMGTLINSATINSYQAKQLNKSARERVSTILGGAHSPKYKKECRMYFKNLWLNLCDRFSVSEYRDLNPLNYNDAFTFINNWSMM